MNDLTKNRTPDELYREYQNTRDDIPEAIFKELVSKAEQVRHEDNIHEILQQAKVQDNAKQKVVAPPRAEIISFAERIKRLLSPATVKVGGTAFASVALAVVILPIAMKTGTPQFSDVAHLDGCSRCGSYISNSLATTRSAAPGLSKTDPQARIAARMGRISANIKIATMLEDDASLKASFKQLIKLTGTSGEQVNDSNSALSLISEQVSQGEFKTSYDAAHAIQVAQITAQFALNEESQSQTNDSSADGASMVEQTMADALSALSSIEPKSTLQENLAEELRALQTNFDVSEKQALNKAVQLYRRAMQSLGA